MIVNDKNKDKIISMIEDAENRATVRTITYDDVLTAIKVIEQELGIPKVCMEGVVFRVDPNAQDFPKAYKYRPYSTQFTLTYRNRKWRIDEISRDTTKRFGYEYVCESMEEVTRNAIVQKKMSFQRCCYRPL